MKHFTVVESSWHGHCSEDVKFFRCEQHITRTVSLANTNSVVKNNITRVSIKKVFLTSEKKLSGIF